MNGVRLQSLRSRTVAWWLLLLLGRVMTPEAAVLHLHAHQHTVDEPAPPRAGRRALALLSGKHLHCHAEQLYNAPALLAGAVRLPVPVRRAVFALPASPATVSRPQVALVSRAGRGPPLT